MKTLTEFTVLIERRALKALFKRLVAATAALAMLGGQPAFAAPGTGQAKKIAKDLQAALDATTTPTAKWAKDINGTRHVQVVIMSGSTDTAMTNLRNDIKGAGGSVHVAMPGLRAVTATLPAAQVARIAGRSDVVTVAPNRTTSRTASALETMTGALTSVVRSNSTKTSYSGLDGTGIGIAVLDSGVMKAHEAFNNASAVTRVKRNVTMLSTPLAPTARPRCSPARPRWSPTRPQSPTTRP
jgi:serine protease AprX